jgi:hypothetical protein
MRADKSEVAELTDDALYLCEEIGNGLHDLDHFKQRFQHVWPEQLDLECSRRRIARARVQLKSEIEIADLLKLIAMLETEKAHVVHLASTLWEDERKDRFRYRV